MSTTSSPQAQDEPVKPSMEQIEEETVLASVITPSLAHQLERGSNSSMDHTEDETVPTRPAMTTPSTTPTSAQRKTAIEDETIPTSTPATAAKPAANGSADAAANASATASATASANAAVTAPSLDGVPQILITQTAEVSQAGEDEEGTVPSRPTLLPLTQPSDEDETVSSRPMILSTPASQDTKVTSLPTNVTPINFEEETLLASTVIPDPIAVDPVILPVMPVTSAAQSPAANISVGEAGDTAQQKQERLLQNLVATARLRTNRFTSEKSIYFIAKRSIDLIFAVTVIVLIAPFLLTVAVAIRLDSPGPIFFKQERVGSRRRYVNGKWQWEKTVFKMYKFRSMYHNVDSARHKAYVEAFIRNDTAAMAQQNPNAQSSGSKPVYKLVNDPRITRVGGFIRSSSIDELPQLFNILFGDMTLVGPRPALQYEVNVYQPWHLKRLEALPGMTGLWQVSARSAVDFDNMVKLDIEYVEKQNLLLDIRILFQTPNAVISRAGAK